MGAGPAVRIALALCVLGPGSIAVAVARPLHRTHPAAASMEQLRLSRQRGLLATQGAAARALAARNATLRDAARRQAAADAIRATALSQATVQAAARVQQTERDAGEAADRTASLSAQRDDAARTLERDAKTLAKLMPTIERLSLYPSETLLAAPADIDDALAGLAVLRGLGRSLERSAETVRASQARLASLGVMLDAERTRLASLQQDQAAQQTALAVRTESARASQRASARQADLAARNAAAAASRATTLDGAVAQIAQAERAAQSRFEQQAAAAERSAQPAAAQEARAGAASLAAPAGPGLVETGGGAPVAGRLVQRFGDQTESGAASGVRYAPPSRATVTAPCAGRIVFAGPFRSYGQMLILDCGRDDRFVLAGLDHADVGVGQAVARGGAVGRMPAWDADAGKGRPSLYVQLRHGDRTIDPGRYLQAGR